MATKKTKKLLKSKSNKVISGVFGGLGEYWGVDATILRLGFVLLVLMTGLFPGVIAYLLAALLVPNK